MPHTLPHGPSNVPVAPSPSLGRCRTCSRALASTACEAVQCLLTLFRLLFARAKAHPCSDDAHVLVPIQPAHDALSDSLPNLGQAETAETAAEPTGAASVPASPLPRTPRPARRRGSNITDLARLGSSMPNRTGLLRVGDLPVDACGSAYVKHGVGKCPAERLHRRRACGITVVLCEMLIIY